MKKLMFGLAALAAGSVMAIESANVVGYQNKGFEASGFNYVCNTFNAVSGDMTLGSISASDDFFYSEIQFLTSEGANATVVVDGLGEVTARYVYWPEGSGAADGLFGWYLFDDADGAYNQNALVIKSGEAFCVESALGEEAATLTFAGQVSRENAVIGFETAGFNYVGNCTPVDITLGDIIASDDFFYSEIQFLTSEGANATVTVDGLGEVTARYVYWPEGTGAADGLCGWYLFDDADGAYNQNARVIKAGEAFCVESALGEENAVITIPSAL